MTEADRVFARFRTDTPPATDRRESLNVPARGTRASRTVEVVHVRSGAPARAIREPRASSRLRAAAWDDGFPARMAPRPPAAPPAEVRAPAEPKARPLPAWASPDMEGEGQVP